MRRTLFSIHASRSRIARDRRHDGFTATARDDADGSHVTPILMVNVVAFVAIAATLAAGLASFAA